MTLANALNFDVKVEDVELEDYAEGGLINEYIELEVLQYWKIHIKKELQTYKRICYWMRSPK